MNATLIRSLLFTLAATCVTYTSLAQSAAQSFRVPGDSGSRWIDTGLDLKPGTLVRLAAKGEVDVGDGRGSYGPQGTQKFPDVAGFPAETSFRYGLVARLTNSRRDPEDDLREQWAYGERQDYCAARGGHLWLTFNDNEPKDNKGEFAVDVTFESCGAQSTAVSDVHSRFRVTLNGFAVNRQTTEQTSPAQGQPSSNALNIDGAGDEVFVRAEVFVLEGTPSGGFRIASHTSLRSAVMGDTSGFPKREQAGTASRTGGLRSGDSYPSATPWIRSGEPQENRLPMLLWEGELRDSRTGMSVVIIPTIWEWDESGEREFGEQWNARMYPYMLDIFDRYGPRFDATNIGPVFQTFNAGVWVRELGTANVPIGRSLEQVIDYGAVQDAVEFSFNMGELTLTYRSAREAARSSHVSYRTATAPGFRAAPGLIEVPYLDRWLTGDSPNPNTSEYTLYLQVENLN